MSVTLNLRVSADKRKPSTKHSYGKEESISHVIQKINKKGNIPSNSFAEHLNELQTCMSIDKQLAILKEITNKYVKSQKEEENKESMYFCIYVLVDIYLSVELKSPLKHGIVRILNSLNEEEKQVVHKELSDSICNRLNQENNDLKTLNEYSNILIGCFESFPLGSASVLACKNVVFDFIGNALQLCSELLSNELSPTHKLEICQCIHSVVRVAVCVVQKSTDCNLEILKAQSLSLVCMEDLPLDTRTNCGLLAVLCAKQDWMQLLTDFCVASSDTTKLCLYSGILNGVPYSHLEQFILKTLDGETPVLRILFNSLMEIQNRNPTDCIIVLSISRIMLLLSRGLQQNPASVLPFLPQLLDYTWTHLDHYMDSVRHLVSSLLEHLVKLNGEGVDVLTPIKQRMQQTPMWSRAKHAALSVLIGRISVEEILISSPDLIANLIEHLKHQVVAAHIVNSYENLMQQHFVEDPDHEKWTNLWVQPIVTALDYGANVSLQQVLAKAVKICPQIVKEIINIENINISTILSCLLVSRKLGLLDKYVKENCKWKGLITYQTLSEAFLHQSDKVRLSCLALLVESHKTTEVFTIAELQLVKQYLTSNLSFRSAASRQQSQGLIIKFLVRLKDSSQTLKKNISQAEKKEEPVGYLNEVVVEYSTFCEWLIGFCIANLFPGANYSRRSTALQILTSCYQLELWPDSKKTSHEGDVLLACLSDSYEDNKSLAMQLLVDIPTLVPAFQDPQQLLYMLKESIRLGASVRPPDSTTAAYIMSTLAALHFSKSTMQCISEEFEECGLLLEQKIIKKEVYCCLLIILKHLSQQLKVAETSLLKAAASGPLYGLLFMVRHLLQQISLKDLETSDSWKALIKEIINISFSCSQAVACIVNSSSPEGHLPMDFDFDTSKLQTLSDEEDSIDPGEVSSQMVLLCSWRTVKEVSLLLGYIAEQASIDNDEKEGLIEQKELLKIGDHLTSMLAETKHRGAFEQAYVGFCKLASRLWRFPNGDLHALPNKWLQETIQEITNGGKLCATRRSAGIPFMIQALICTELEVKGSSTLNIWMNQLLDMAENENLSAETHTHALNIMRTLFRNTQLGETVSPFVESAIIVTVIGFSASTWPERNSATLLLSTLVSRVFGVPRSKSHILSWKNKMTGRIFFQRYPKLFDFFRDQLEKATKSCNKTSLHPSLYPVLLFLGRLYPSSLEGTDSNLQLSEYIPYIRACAGSSVLKTRTLAAAAMVPLITPDKLPQCLTNFFSDLTQCSLNTNEKHGILLQACFLLEYTTELPQEILNEMEQLCEKWVLNLSTLFETKQCPLVMETLLKVIFVLSTKYYKRETSKIWTIEINRLLLHLRPKEIGYSLCLKTCAKTMLKTEEFQKTEDVINVIGQLLCHEEYDVVCTVLDFLYTLLSSSKDQSENSYLKTSSNEMLRCDVLKDRLIAELIMNKMCSKAVHTSDMEKILAVAKVYPLLLRLFSEKFGVRAFVELCVDKDELRVVDVLECICALLDEEISCSEEDINAINNLLVQYSQPECGEDCHQAVSLLLVKHLHTLSSNKLPLDSRLKAYTSMVQLQCDDPTTWQTLMEKLVHNEADLYCKAVVLLALALGDLTNETSTLELPKGQVFDKGEVSSFYEEAIISQQAGKHFKNLLHCIDEQCLQTTLLPALTEFINYHCGIEADTLGSILSSVKVLDEKRNYDGVLGFLKNGYHADKLRSIKIKHVL